jgi:hypothetical protein
LTDDFSFFAESSLILVFNMILGVESICLVVVFVSQIFGPSGKFQLK